MIDYMAGHFNVWYMGYKKRRKNAIGMTDISYIIYRAGKITEDIASKHRCKRHKKSKKNCQPKSGRDKTSSGISVAVSSADPQCASAN